MEGGFRFGVPLCGGLVCSENERLALQAALHLVSLRKGGDAYMSTGICKSPDSRYWRELYKAALSEIDKSKLPARVAEAEKAVVIRARELFRAAGDNGEETEALEDVMYALHALESNWQMRQGPPQSLKNGEPLVLPYSLS
jgi:hypothetical protein